jgi:Putative zinc-finger
MMFAHLRLRHLVSLLAAEALTGKERAAVQAHALSCARCRAEHDLTRAFLGRLGEDPLRAEVRRGEVPLPLPVLVYRVQEGIDRALAGPRPAAARPWSIGQVAALAAALALAVAIPALYQRTSVRVPDLAAVTPEVSAEALTRLERNVAREQTARYLNEAQDVLATVASSPRDCEKAERRVDVEAESRRSRELLARRALLLDAHEGAVASAQPVLDDVEQILREVASMEACARFRDVERLQGEIERRQLLMKVRLMQRELLG